MSDDLRRDYEWLAGDEARSLLALAGTWSKVTPARIAELRRACTPQRAGLIVEQVALRRRARAKFASADEMFFTPLGLEQATDEIIARYKAARMPAGGSLIDLCSGLGGDLLALAARASTLGVDRDPILATVARANLEVLRREAPSATVSASRVEIADACEVDLAGVRAWHIDPDRRPAGRRTTRVELHEPSAEVLTRLLDRNANAAIKLAPAAVLPEDWPARAELEWISRGGECRQLVAWFGELAEPAGARRATVLRNTSSPVAQIQGIVEAEPPPAARIGRYVYEPDAAVLAAGLAGTLARRLGVEPLAPGVAYWTSDALVEESATSAFEVLDVLSAGVKQLKPALRSRNIGVLEIKKRAIDVDPQRLRRELALRGDDAASLLLARIGGRSVAILARRLR